MAVAKSYIEGIAALNPLTLDGIAAVCRDMLPLQFRKFPSKAAYPDKDFTALFTTEDQMNGYCAAYTQWHKAKLRIVLDRAKQAGAFSSGDISVIDWGCGQGLATLFLNEYLNEQGIANCRIREVMLVEPALAPLERAELNVRIALNGSSVRTVSKALNEFHKELDSFSGIVTRMSSRVENAIGDVKQKVSSHEKFVREELPELLRKESAGTIKYVGDVQDAIEQRLKNECASVRECIENKLDDSEKKFQTGFKKVDSKIELLGSGVKKLTVVVVCSLVIGIGSLAVASYLAFKLVLSK